MQILRNGTFGLLRFESQYQRFTGHMTTESHSFGCSYHGDQLRQKN